MNLSFLMCIKDFSVWNEGENWILQVNLVNPFLLCKHVYLISLYQFRNNYTQKCSRRWLCREKARPLLCSTNWCCDMIHLDAKTSSFMFIVGKLEVCWYFFFESKTCFQNLEFMHFCLWKRFRNVDWMITSNTWPCYERGAFDEYFTASRN